MNVEPTGQANADLAQFTRGRARDPLTGGCEKRQRRVTVLRSPVGQKAKRRVPGRSRPWKGTCGGSRMCPDKAPSCYPRLTSEMSTAEGCCARALLLGADDPKCCTRWQLSAPEWPTGSGRCSPVQETFCVAAARTLPEDKWSTPSRANPKAVALRAARRRRFEA